jgi:hypothetical protein
MILTTFAYNGAYGIGDALAVKFAADGSWQLKWSLHTYDRERVMLTVIEHSKPRER